MSIRHLAILGGTPEFDHPLHVGRPNLPDRVGFERRLASVLDSGWLTNDGPMVRELEREVAAVLDVEHCIAVANATLGLELVLRCLGLEGEVILPSFTFVATAHVVRLAGLEPVFCDIDPETHNLDPSLVQRLITERTAAILGVHVWGRPCAVDELEALARRAAIPLVFDAAHAFACSGQGRMVGGFGRAEVFSLHATKFLHSFEGGLVTTNDPDLAKQLRLARNFGFAGYDQVVSLGTNAKLSEAHAAMALSNLAALDQLLQHNRVNLETYQRELGSVAGLSTVDTWSGGAGNAQYVIVEVADPAPTRDQVVAALQAENVLARRYFYPGAHRSAPYAEKGLTSLVETDSLSSRVLALPTGLAVSPSQVEQVARLLQSICEHFAGASTA